MKEPYELKNLVDDFLWSKENKIITQEKHHVPGLANISHWNYKSAASVADFHYHKDIFEMHCMVHGRRIFQTLDGQELSTSVVTGNQLAITFPGEIHGYQDDFAQPYEFYSLQIDVSDPDHLLGLDEAYSRCLYEELLHLQHTMEDLHAHRLTFGSTHLRLLVTAFNLFSAYNPETETFDLTSIQTGVQFLCCFFFSLKYMPITTTEGAIDEHIRAAIQYIHSHYLDAPNLDVLAETAGYSLSYFKTKFREETGITPADYVTMQRIADAKKRLTQSNSSITAIAMGLNFSSASYFCSVFKKFTTYSPAEYREKYSVPYSAL